jgi:sodium/proline symporter
MSMPNHGVDMSVVVFTAALLATFAVALIGRRHSRRVSSAALSEQYLNRWLVGLSAGATANSGFVVTAAVGLGYSFGVQWLLLPLSWFLGDLLFWTLFPHRINATGRTVKAATMTDVIVDGMKARSQSGFKQSISVLIVLCLGAYISAQWLAGEKFLQGAFGFDGIVSLFTFAALIVVFCRFTQCGRRTALELSEKA